MKIEIRHRVTGAVLFAADLADMADNEPRPVRTALLAAIAARAYLSDAYLTGANLADAYLAGANLARAYLADARNLPIGVEATSPTEPYVRDIALDAERRARRAERYRAANPEVPVVEHLNARILDIVNAR